MTKVVYFIVLFELFNGKIVCGHSNGDYPVSFCLYTTGYLYVECVPQVLLNCFFRGIF